jgi:hypothetical protein
VECGAKVIRNRLTIRNLFAHLSEQFLNYDNKFLQTFLGLLIRPQEVIGLYINGTRKRYMNVISYFAIAISFAGFFTFVNQKFFPDTYAQFFKSMNQDEFQAEFTSQFYSMILEYQSFIIFMMVPVLALMSKLVFLRNKKFNYTEHLVINMYAYSEVSIIITFFSFFLQLDTELFGLFSLFFLPLQIFYFAYVYMRLYQLSFVQIVLKSMLFLVILAVFYIIFVILLLLYTVLFTDLMERAIEIEKAKRATSYIISSAMNWTS